MNVLREEQRDTQTHRQTDKDLVCALEERRERKMLERKHTHTQKRQ